MAEKTRNLKLSDLERRVKMRRSVKRPNKKSALKTIGGALQKFNQSFTKSANKMPSDKDVYKDMWNG